MRAKSNVVKLRNLLWGICIQANSVQQNSVRRHTNAYNDVYLHEK